MAKTKSTKDTKKLEELKTNLEKQISKKDIEIEKPKKKDIEIEKPVKEKKPKKEKKEKKSKVRKKRERKVKDQILHEYIPEHVLIIGEEREELEKKVGCENLPHILISDPGIRHLEVSLGDVIKIKRFNPKVGDVYYYRLVVTD